MENSLHSGRKTTQVRWHEDWVAVAIGFLMILASLVWFVIPVPVYQWNASRELLQNVLAVDNFTSIGLQFIYFYTMVVLGSILMGRSVQGSLLMFPVVYVLTVVALIIAGNGVMRSLNLEAVIFSLLIGLIIGNTLSLPAWFREALSTELFVKTGLVLLGTGVIFSDILTAGTLGLIQSLVVVISVWYFAYWLCKKFKLDGEFT